jgi:hypothetical protein
MRIKKIVEFVPVEPTAGARATSRRGSPVLGGSFGLANDVRNSYHS